jgi:hypothetical protein
MKVPCNLDKEYEEAAGSPDELIPSRSRSPREGLSIRRQVSWLVDLPGVAGFIIANLPSPLRGPVVIWTTILHLQWRDRAGF